MVKNARAVIIEYLNGSSLSVTDKDILRDAYWSNKLPTLSGYNLYSWVENDFPDFRV